MRHLIDSTDLSVAEIDRVLNLADDIIRDPPMQNPVAARSWPPCSMCPAPVPA